MTYLENHFQWTVDMLSLYGRTAGSIEPPCPSLPRTVHLQHQKARYVVSDETREKHRTAMSGKSVQTSASSSLSTAQKYLPRILELQAQGYKQYEIGAALGIHPVAVSRMLKMFPSGV